MQSLLRARGARRVLFMGCALILLSACGGSNDTTPPVVAGTLSVAVTPATLSLPVGGIGTASASIVRGGSFTGDVALAATAPTGVTVTLGTATLGAGITVSTVSVAVATTATPTPAATPATITITATGSGVTTTTATLALTVTAASAPSATLAISSATATLQAKDTTATTVATVARVGGFTGDLTLSQTGAPTGVTVTFAPSPIGASATTSTITIRSSASAPPGNHSIIISAAGTGITAPTATYSLRIDPVPTLTVSVAPTATSIVAGASGSATATIVRGGGFTDAVALTATGAPPGMTVTFTPASVAAGSTTSAIAIAVGSGVPANITYPITINAAGTGVTATPVALNVTVPAVVSGTTVTISYCAADAPIWLAYQDGAGAWTRVAPNSGTNTYQFSLASGKGGVATVDTVGTGYTLDVSYATTAELNGLGKGFFQGLCGAKTVRGSVVNVSSAQGANVSLGRSGGENNGLPSFSLFDVAAGPQDLFASRVNATTERADKLILRRGLNIPDGGTLAVLDFNAAEAFAPASANVTVSGLGADTAQIVSGFDGTRGSASGRTETFRDYIAATGARPYDAIPLAQLASGELQLLLAGASAANNFSSERVAFVWFRNPTDQTLALGPALSTPTVTRISGGAYSRVRAQLAVQTEYNRSFTAEYEHGSPSRTTTILASTGYVGGAAWDFSIPDLSGATGWNPTWGLQNGISLFWSVTAYGGSLSRFGADATDGSTLRRATVNSGAVPFP